MTPDPRVEAGARAMYERDDPAPHGWDAENDGVKAWYRKMATYALAAADAVDPLRIVKAGTR
jgi:hypothetical protein